MVLSINAEAKAHNTRPGLAWPGLPAGLALVFSRDSALNSLILLLLLTYSVALLFGPFV